MDKKLQNYESKVRKVGNSLVVTVSVACRNITGFQENDKVYINAENGKMTIANKPYKSTKDKTPNCKEKLNKLKKYL